MNIDDNAFICTRKKVDPPYGPFGTRGERTYEVCVSNTFGDVREQLKFARDDREQNFIFEQTMNGIGLSISAIARFVTGLKNSKDSIAAADDAISGDCTKVLAAHPRLLRLRPEKLLGYSLTNDWWEALDAWVDACTARSVPASKFTLEKLKETVLRSPDPLERTNWASRITGFDGMSGHEKILFVLGALGSTVAAINLISSITKSSQDLIFLPEQEKLLSEGCKYATSREYLPLRFCNFKADSIADDVKRQCAHTANVQTVTAKNFCYLPALGYNTRGVEPLPDAAGIVVVNGIKVIFKNPCEAPDLEYGGILYLNQFLLDLSTSLSLRGRKIPEAITTVEAGTNILAAITLTVGVQNYITCASRVSHATIKQTASMQELTGSKIEYDYTIPRVLAYSLNVSDISELGTCNHAALGVPQHYELVGVACHQFGDQVMGADY